MSFRLSLKTSQPPPAADGSPVQTPGSARPKIKLTASQPPTPASEQPPNHITASSGATATKKSKKRTANDDTASPAAKRLASATGRRTSVILKLPSQRNNDDAQNTTPTSAGPRIKLTKRKSSGPKLKRINVKGRVPERVLGNAYDSEDSDRERDPATEQHFVLRMQPGEDCNLLRKAITERTIGLAPQEGGVDVTFKFVDRELRRAVVTIRGHMYAAALVDLPCIVETMKSWDKRGWWKVADISQMLLVLGRINTEDQARTHPLPERVLNDKTWAFAHGLTPPMHWVRKRRFRKRLSYKDTANVEEEVNRLIMDDEQAEKQGGAVKWEVHTRESLERSTEPQDYDEFGDGAVNTIESDGYDDAGEEPEEMDVDDAEAQIQALFDQELAAQAVSPTTAAANITSAVLSGSPVAITAPVSEDRSSGTPAETPAPARTPTADDLFGNQDDEDDEDESSDEDDEDDDDDDDDLDAFDEDAQARAAEKNIQQQEIQDLENEINLQRQKLAATKNQLLLQRQRDKLKSLEEDLQMKRRVYGLDDGEDE